MIVVITVITVILVIRRGRARRNVAGMWPECGSDLGMRGPARRR
jgi:hypothetical protein